MILQAAGLALLAAISPTALLVAAVYLGSARPRLVGTLYLAGAIIMSLVMGLVVIAILRNTGLSLAASSTPRYGLRLGLGIVLLAAGAVLARRKPKPPDPDKKQGLISRMIANPAPASAFAVGLLLFAPGPHVHRRPSGDRHRQRGHRIHRDGRRRGRRHQRGFSCGCLCCCT